MRTIQWDLLSAPFAPEDIEWRPLTISKKTSKGLAAAYLTARAVAQRLDDVFGVGGWKNEYREAPGGGIMCRLYFRDESGEWIWREDGADRTDVEPTKGGLSAAFKRAGAALGIGRYLYDLPQQWVPVDDYGKFKEAPAIPRQYLPAPATRDAVPRADAPPRHPAPAREAYDAPDAYDEPCRERPARPDGDGRPGTAPRGFRPVTR